MADSSSTKKKSRSVTSCQELTSRRPPGYKYPIGFDEFGEPTGEYAIKFKTFVAMMARNKPSILANDWDAVPAGIKDLIWQDVTVIPLFTNSYNYYCLLTNFVYY